jgi:hypothetical protein
MLAKQPKMGVLTIPSYPLFLQERGVLKKMPFLIPAAFDGSVPPGLSCSNNEPFCSEMETIKF